MNIAALVTMLIAVSGCSVGMAMSGKPDPNIATLSTGQSRDIVILNLGQPTSTSANESGRVDVFQLERGNAPSAGRAAFHGAMDVLTLGIWEIVGTPVEGFAGDKFSVTVEYDKDDKVRRVQSSTGTGAPSY